MNIIEVYQKLADDMTLLINNKLNNIARDRTFKAKIIEKVSYNKYKIQYKNRYYTARCHAELSVGDMVYVCAPEDNWSELFINLPCSRREFDTIKHQCKVLNNDLAGNTYYNFTAYPADWITSSGRGFSHQTVSINSTGNFNYAPPTKELGGFAWWNVLTFGVRTRCTQIAFFSFLGTTGGGKIYMRYQHDNMVSAWMQVL